MFFGDSATIHSKIKKKMFEILYANTEYDFLDQPCRDEIDTLRKTFSVFDIQELQTDRPLLQTEKHLQFFTFTGTRINRTIQLILNIAGISNKLDDSSSSFDIEVSHKEFVSKFDLLNQPLATIEVHIANLLQTSPAILNFSKWGLYLPEVYQVKLVKDKYFDLEQAKQFLSTIQLINNK